MNICKGLCKENKCPKLVNSLIRYDTHFWCTSCQAAWIHKDAVTTNGAIRCPCCNNRLRTRPLHKRKNNTYNTPKNVVPKKVEYIIEDDPEESSGSKRNNPYFSDRCKRTILICKLTSKCPKKYVTHKWKNRAWKKEVPICLFNDTCNQKETLLPHAASRRYGAS